jgi:hypothetical protein
MEIEEIIGQLEQISQAPGTSEKDKIALEQACKILRATPLTIDSFTKAIQLLAAIAGIATYIQQITS